MKSLPARPAVAAFVLLLATVLPVRARLPRPQVTPPGVQVDAGTPCCNITVVDALGGVVIATEDATDRIFRFQVADRALLL